LFPISQKGVFKKATKYLKFYIQIKFVKVIV